MGRLRLPQKIRVISLLSIVNDSTSSESYQHGISLEKASVGKYFWMGSVTGFAITKLRILPSIPTFCDAILTERFEKARG